MTRANPKVVDRSPDPAPAGKSRRRPKLAPIRKAELERLYRHRWGRLLPEDDEGRDCLFILLSHIANLASDVDQHLELAFEWAPWMPISERDELRQRALTTRVFWDEEELAVRLGVTFAERTIVRLKSMGCIDCDKLGRAEIQRDKRKARSRAARRKKSLKPKAPPSTWARTIAVLDLLPEKAELPMKRLREELRGSEEFAGLSIGPALHRAIKQLEAKGLVRTRKVAGAPGRMSTMWVGRCRQRDIALPQTPKQRDGRGVVVAPTNPDEYRRYLLEKLDTFTPATAEEGLSKWYLSAAEREIRLACGIGPSQENCGEFHATARARRSELLGPLDTPSANDCDEVKK